MHSFFYRYSTSKNVVTLKTGLRDGVKVIENVTIRWENREPMTSY